MKIPGVSITSLKHGRDFLVGVDLGQARDYTAICIVERIDRFSGKHIEGTWEKKIKYEVPFIERPPLGTPYPKIVTRLKDLIDNLPKYERINLVVDNTGVGRPVVDLMRTEGLNPRAINMTGGSGVGFGNGALNVPKRVLVSNLAILLQSGRLKIGKNVEEAEALIEELQNFKMKISLAGNDSYEAWRESDHDDLVIAAAIAAWFGEKAQSSLLNPPQLPPPPIDLSPPTFNDMHPKESNHFSYNKI